MPEERRSTGTLTTAPGGPRVGYVTPNSWGVPTVGEIVELGVRAEAAGASSLWVSHHVLHVGFVGERLGRGPYFDPIVTLGLLAQATTTARIGSSVLVLPYLHPMTTAKALATVDHISEGRLDVGVGVGGLRVEHDAIGQVSFERRGRYANEWLDVAAALWTPGPSSFHGEFFSFDELEAYPGPFGPAGIPILVGGHDDAAFRRTATRGAAWHGIGVEPGAVPPQRELLAAALDEVGRSIDEVPYQVRLHIDIADLDTSAWQDRVAAYGEAGVDDLVLAPQSADPDAHRRWIDVVLVALAG